MTGIVVCGSIATDHLMVFPGRFVEHLVSEKLDRVSLSFLVDDLEIRRGGVGPNICYGLANLGAPSSLVGAVGADFAEYGRWLADLGVDTSGVRISETRHTARFVCTTDESQNQIASFYAGAMAEAGDIDLAAVLTGAGADIVLVGADDPAAMIRHTEACRRVGTAFAADPSQQLARMPGEEIRQLVDGATYLFSNEYEHMLLCKNTGWTETEILDRVGVWITTLGAAGARIDQAGQAPVAVPGVPAQVADPTGGGDAFRAGFLASRSWGYEVPDAARVGCALATEAIEALGGQGYSVEPERFAARFASAYGAAAAERLSDTLTDVRSTS